MNMLADPAAWLPAEQRKPGEPGDDWTWTLRSAANRPILRVLEDGQVVLAQAGDAEGGHSAPMKVHAAVMGGDAGFGEGGIHDVIALDRVPVSGSDVVLQADLALPVAGFAGAPSAEVDAGYERTGAFGEASRVVMSYASHPELASDGNIGMQWMRMASAERMRLGDAVDVEAGGTVYAIHAGDYALTTQPFLRVTVHPGEVWAVRYRMATSHDVQQFDSLDSLAGETPAAAMIGGRLATESGMHQELAVTRKAGNGMVRVAVYHDAISHPAIAGTGAANPAALASNGVVVDTATGSFRLLGAGYSANGVSVAVAEPVLSQMWATVEYASGAGMAASDAGGQQLAAAALHPVSSCAATAAVEGGFAKAGTKVRASYRWQQHSVVTSVNSYGAGSDQAFLSFDVRQSISLGGLLPQGLVATVDVTNLLAEGYHPFLSADGRTLYLAQSPRTVRAGLAFTF